MFKKKFVPFAFIIGISLSVFLLGCGTNETSEDISKKVEEGVTKTGETASDLVKKITDSTMDYNSDDLKKDVESKGYIPKEVEEGGKSYFSAENNDFIINGETFSVYQYNAEDNTKLEDDLRSVTDNGMKINDTNVNWKTAPHIYKKGRVVVIYDGDNEIALTEAKEILGNPVLG
ncbi:hypothetical protein [Clostridium vincentii]|uniref:Lipoprotein n=1 Tax=Clostridium vincentii TaxID=52704 RepID=A0A2T0BBU2_9CLOT|nr:hypothetical protein [Clostridium vincentii]PRR81348.1 hypothetical protein CLVI_25810 [Clostridium vincentii]